MEGRRYDDDDAARSFADYSVQATTALAGNSVSRTYRGEREMRASGYECAQQWYAEDESSSRGCCAVGSRIIQPETKVLAELLAF